MVSIETWRAHIGSFHRHRSPGCKWKFLPCASPMVLVVKLHFLVCLALLVIGNVEVNPGPDQNFKCKVPACNAVLSTLQAYTIHQQKHVNVYNFKFHCGLCKIDFSSYSSLSCHVSRYHKEDRQREVLPVSQPCMHCHLSFVSSTNLLRHLMKVHADSTAIECPLRKDCNHLEPFASKAKFGKHLSQQHPGWREEVCQDQHHSIEEPSTSSLPVENMPEFINMDVDVDIDNEEPFFDAESSFTDCSDDDIFKFLASFYTSLEVELLIPVVKIDTIAEKLSLLSEMTAFHMRNQMRKEMETQGISEDIIRPTLAKLLDSNLFYLAHQKNVRGPCFNTEHLRNKYISEVFHTVKPVGVPLGEETVDEDHYHYVSVTETLSMLLSDDSIKQEVLNSFQRNASVQENVLTDYTDGEVCKGRNLPAKRIDLIMFQDGFSSTSMLTTVRQKHKVLGVYMTIGNLSPFLRTKLKSMHLVLLALENHVKKYRQECFEKLQVELSYLEDQGIQFMGEQIPVFLQFFVGDNLGSHFLGGFVEGFTATYPCRFCPITRDEFKSNPDAVLPLRTHADYLMCANMVEQKEVRGSHHHGVKENSVFNRLKSFKICDPGLPPCLGHDLFHGVVDWDLTSIIRYFVTSGWFTYDVLNARVSQFKYSGPDSKNKPAPVSPEGEKLGGSAVQNWTLLRLLPLIIEGLIKDSSDHIWKLYIKLKSISEVVCAPNLMLTQVEALDDLISSYMRERSTFSQILRPKHHYLRHYPGLMKKFGPLIHLWGMRFEQKHQIMKNIARRANNYKDLTMTMSNKHQLLFGYESGGVRYQDSVSKCKLFDVRPEFFAPDLYKFIQELALTGFKATKSIKKNGLKFNVNDAVILSSSTSSCLDVGLIKCILFDGSCIKFIFGQQKAFYNDLYGLHEVTELEPEQLISVDLSSLRFPCVQPVYTFHDKEFISLKHCYPSHNV